MILAATCGFIVRECAAVLPAIKDDANTPGKFSFRYYFTQPRNIVLLVMNLFGSLALLLGHGEVMHLLAKIPFVAPYVEGVAVPVLTGAAIGYAGASLFRWMAKGIA